MMVHTGPYSGWFVIIQNYMFWNINLACLQIANKSSCIYKQVFRQPHRNKWSSAAQSTPHCEKAMRRNRDLGPSFRWLVGVPAFIHLSPILWINKSFLWNNPFNTLCCRIQTSQDLIYRKCNFSCNYKLLSRLYSVYLETLLSVTSFTLTFLWCYFLACKRHRDFHALLVEFLYR